MSYYYDALQVCLKGHQITDKYNRSPQDRRDFCIVCGEKTIHACPECKQEIRGAKIYDYPNPFSERTPIPEYCHNCGASFPWIIDKIKNKDIAQTANSDSVFQKLELIFNKFHTIAKVLESRHSARQPLKIDDEYDVQYLLYALLQLFFEVVYREEPTPSLAGKSYKIDFVLPKESIAVEVKKTRKGLEDGVIRSQLIDDISGYHKHPEAKMLVFFVYDPEELITNPKIIENDLSKDEENYAVKIFIRPKKD